MYSILHLETSTFFSKLLSDICTELNIKYFNASKAEEAMSILHKVDISLIITAMELIDETSDKFIITLNESEFKKTPIVVITGNDTFEGRKKMFNLGIVDYIIKKSSVDEIKQNITSYKNDSEIMQKMSTLKFAVCDDSQLDRKIIERIFMLNNIKNFMVYDSGEKLLSSHVNYDVYVLDLVMKNLDGQTIIHTLRQAGNEAVIFVISSVDNIKTISKVMAIGADDYITKPFNNDIFMSRLKTNVRSYLLLQEVKDKTILLERAAITDGLTDLYNHKHIFKILDNEIEKVLFNKNTLSIIMLDIDYFKRLNDAFGHQFGDIILKKISEIIRSCIRSTDIAGRYGGEEFMVILPGADLESARSIAEKIRSKVERIRSRKEKFSTSISGGIKEFSGEPAKDFVKSADDLLYKAKNNGRNRIEY